MPPSPHSPSRRGYLIALFLGYGAWWIAWAIRPLSPSDWRLENVLILFTVAVLIVTARWFVFSRTAYTLVVIFAAIHTVGAHYTYAEVPIGRWIESLTGRSLPWERNHFDRVVHFLYGLLILWPYREAFFHAATPSHPFWGYLLPLSFILSTSLGYELLEWAAAEVFGGDLGMAFLGTQGDVWDAHWDMLWASIGAVLATAIMIAIHATTGRDFPREWARNQLAREGGENGVTR
ncbi:MAG: DUF2238 domain-containing protein [Verrucomicrobiae bacterium]|nr:DUF2238 domain-containing protein [Verrucomicrobiae bacterium]